MHVQNESIFGTVLNTVRTQDSANLADIDADNTAALNEPTAALDPILDEVPPGDSSQMVSNPLAVMSPVYPSTHDADDDQDHYMHHDHEQDNSRLTDRSAGPKNSLSFASAGDVGEGITAAFAPGRSMGRVRSQQRLAGESSMQSAADAAAHGAGDFEDQEQFTSVHTGQEPSAMSVDSGHLDGGVCSTKLL